MNYDEVLMVFDEMIGNKMLVPASFIENLDGGITIVRNALAELSAIKQIPTQEEVCNALEDDTGSTITFKTRKQSDTTQVMFIIGDVEATFLDFIGYNLKYKTVCYSNFEELLPKTLILLMRFFEGYEDIIKGEEK